MSTTRTVLACPACGEHWPVQLEDLANEGWVHWHRTRCGVAPRFVAVDIEILAALQSDREALARAMITACRS